MLLSLDKKQLPSAQLEWGTPLMSVTEPESLRRLFTIGRPTVGTVRQPPRDGPEHLFAIRVPLLRSGQLTFALSAIVDVASLERIVQ
jgi:hypothetical protein